MSAFMTSLRALCLIALLPMGGALANGAPHPHKVASPNKPTTTSSQEETPDTQQPSALKGGCTRVWLNTKSMIYHPVGSHWYRHTMQGSEMCEEDAKSAGGRASRARNE